MPNIKEAWDAVREANTATYGACALAFVSEAAKLFVTEKNGKQQLYNFMSECDTTELIMVIFIAATSSDCMNKKLINTVTQGKSELYGPALLNALMNKEVSAEDAIDILENNFRKLPFEIQEMLRIEGYAPKILREKLKKKREDEDNTE